MDEPAKKRNLLAKKWKVKAEIELLSTGMIESVIVATKQGCIFWDKVKSAGPCVIENHSSKYELDWCSA